MVAAGHLAATLDGIGRVICLKLTADMFEPWNRYVAQFGWQAAADQFAGATVGVWGG